MFFEVVRKPDTTCDVFWDGDMDESVPRAKLPQLLLWEYGIVASTVDEMLDELDREGRTEKLIPLSVSYQWL